MSTPTPGSFANAIADATDSRTRLLLKRSTFNGFADYGNDQTVTEEPARDVQEPLLGVRMSE